MASLFLIYSAILFVAFVLLILRHPQVAILVLVPIVLLRATGMPLIPLASVGGLTLYLTDGLFLGTACATALQVVLRRNYRPWPSLYKWGFALLLAGAGASVLRGLLAYGLAQAANEARSVFYFLSGLGFALFVLAARLARRELVRLLAGLVAASFALAVVRLILRGVGTSQGIILSTGEYVDARAVDAATALLIAQGLWLLLFFAHRASIGRFEALGCVVLVIVVVLQHRSVWVATAVGVILTFLLATSGWRRLATRAPLLLGAAAALGLVLTYGGLYGVASDLTASTQSAFAGHSTLTGRVDGWQLLLRDPRMHDTLGVLLGLPSGAGFDRVVDGRLATYSPHNFYVQIILRGGLLGMAGLMVLLAGGTLAFRRRSAPALTGIGLLSTTAVFFMAYGPAAEQGIVVGSALALLAKPRPVVSPVVPSRRIVRPPLAGRPS